MPDLFDSKTDTLDHVTRCLSLIQPWASLVACGAKKYETRSWSTPYRGWLAIHASKGFPNDCRALCLEDPFVATLRKVGYTTLGEIPRAKVIAVVHLVDCISTNAWTPPQDSEEYAFGNYGPDRFAWKFEEVRLVRPFEVKGSLSIWRLPRPLNQADLL